MNDSSFLKEFLEILEVSEGVFDKTIPLNKYDYWDSLAIVSTIALVDRHFANTVTEEEIVSCESYADLIFMISNRKKEVA